VRWWCAKLRFMADEVAETGATGTQVTIIKRTSAPETMDGTRWHVQLSGTPARTWLDFFKAAGKSDGTTSPQLVVFDRASASFKSDEDHVERWIEALDRWIASADARYRLSVDEANRERSVKLDAEAKQRERIQQLNDRFKNL
jgi:hypothetical protein